MKYKVLVKTDSYTGNFEREMCAHMTGCMGECEVGEEYIDRDIQEIFENIIGEKSDDSGCRRPVELAKDVNNFWIFFRSKPSAEQLELLDARAKTFVETSLEIDQYPSMLNYLGLEVYMGTTVVEKIEI